MTEKTITLPFIATDKQRPFVESPAMFKLGGGARGGGKSHCLAGMAVLLSIMFPGNVGYMGRADLLDFRRTTLPLVLQLIPPELLVNHHKQENYIDVLSVDGRTTSRMWYGEMKDPGSLLSGNIGWFFIDEAYEVPQETFVNLAGAMRGKLPNGQERPFFGLLASNPAAGWLMDTFPVLEEEQELIRLAIEEEGENFTPFPSPFFENKVLSPNYAYFPFRARDNEHAGGLEYEARLIEQYGKLGPTWVSRMVYGVWDATMEGLVYQLEERHMWQPPRKGTRLYRPGVPVVLAGDPSNGSGVYAVNVLQLYRGRVLVIDEFNKPGGTDEDFEAWLKTQPYAKDVNDGVFDPAKPDTIKRLRSWGIPVRGMRRKKDVVEQINSLKLSMSPNEYGICQILIDKEYCPETVNEFRRRVYPPVSRRNPNLRRSEKPLKAHDHHLNALEYFFYDRFPFGQPQEQPNQGVQQQVEQSRRYLLLA